MMFSAMRIPTSKRLSSAFSLVEVTLAVAIAALAIITLLGLLPQGLDMARKTAVLTSNTNILEQLIRDLENTQWAAFPSDRVKKYFNDQGREVTSGAKDISYVAELDFTQGAALPRGEISQPFLRRVIIRVAASGSADFVFGETNRVSYVTFNHLIAKSR